MPGCRMPERPGTAAMSATLAVARDRARRRPGSGGSSPPHAVPQAEQLPLDTPIAPAWVLPRQLFHRRAHLGRDRWPARRVRVDPFLRDQAPVPCQQRSRSHDPVQAEVSGQQPRQGRQHGTVSPVRLRAGYLPAQGCNLMPEHHDLRLLSGVAPRQEHQPAGHPDHEDVYEANEHERRASSSRSGPRAGFWHGTGLETCLGSGSGSCLRNVLANNLGTS